MMGITRTEAKAGRAWEVGLTLNPGQDVVIGGEISEEVDGCSDCLIWSCGFWEDEMRPMMT